MQLLKTQLEVIILFTSVPQMNFFQTLDNTGKGSWNCGCNKVLVKGDSPLTVAEKYHGVVMLSTDT